MIFKNIFIIVALKLLSDHSYITVISVLTSADHCFPCKLTLVVLHMPSDSELHPAYSEYFLSDTLDLVYSLQRMLLLFS